MLGSLSTDTDEEEEHFLAHVCLLRTRRPAGCRAKIRHISLSDEEFNEGMHREGRRDQHKREQIKVRRTSSNLRVRSRHGKKSQAA